LPQEKLTDSHWTCDFEIERIDGTPSDLMDVLQGDADYKAENHKAVIYEKSARLQGYFQVISKLNSLKDNEMWL